MIKDEVVPYWRRGLALVALAGIAAFVVLDWDRFRADFWPIDRSPVGPNILATVVQAAVVLVVAALLWPPTRRRIHAFVDGKLDGIHQRIDVHHALRKREHEERMEAHRSLERRLEALAAAHEAHRAEIAGRLDSLHAHVEAAAGRALGRAPDDPS